MVWQFWVLIGIAIASIVIALIFNKEESSKQINDTASSIFSMILGSVWLPVWLFIQWMIGLIIKQIPIEKSDEIFFDIFRYLFGIVTLIFVLIEVVKNIIVAYKAAKKRISG